MRLHVSATCSARTWALSVADFMQDDLDMRFGNVDRKKKKKQAGKESKDETPKSEKRLTFVPYSKYKNGVHLIPKICKMHPCSHSAFLVISGHMQHLMMYVIRYDS